ncbi:MAG: vWA domain-containing protein, partial [Planctomycetota bacterium]
RDCVLTQNSTSGSGGGVYLGGYIDPESSVGLELNNCLIHHNRATYDGGGVSCDWLADVLISNCTIAHNEVTGAFGYGGGLYCGYESHVEVIDSIIWGNVSSYQGSQVAVSSGDPLDPMPSVLTITYSDIEPEPDPNEVTDITGLDLVFCIDTTSSMGGDIEAVKASATEIVEAIGGRVSDYRIAVVDYRDFNESPYGSESVDYPYKDDLVFETDLDTIVAAINEVNLGAGADGPESVLAGLMHCIDHNALEEVLDSNYYGADPNWRGPGPWRSTVNVSRAIILMGDAPPHMPPDYTAEPFTDYLIEDIVAAATEGPAPIRIFTIPVRGWGATVEAFTALAEGTGGAMLEAADSSEVVDAIMTAIGLLTRRAPMTYVDPNSTLAGWLPDSNSWNPDTNNIAVDPCFINIAEDPELIAGYYLSHVDAGQDVDSPCINAGSADVNDPNIAIDPNKHTTRTDGYGDIGIVDMGYH